MGGVRLISSASSRLVKTGPLTKRNSRRPVARSSSMISEPVMSPGSRSGVNCTRLKSRCSTLASVEIISVLARPGTPISRTWASQNRAIRTSSMTSFWPTMTLAISAWIFW